MSKIDIIKLALPLLLIPLLMYALSDSYQNKKAKLEGERGGPLVR